MMASVFKYPSIYRFLYLWGPYIAIPMWLMLLTSMALTGVRVMALAVGGSVALLLVLYLIERYVLSALPIAIELCDDHLRLYRNHLYVETEIGMLMTVEEGVSLPFQPLLGGWVRVRFRTGDNHATFYIAPYLVGYADLVGKLKKALMESRVPVISVFAWPLKKSVFMVAWAVVTPAVFFFLAVQAWQDFGAVVGVVSIALAGGLGLCFPAWILCCSPSRVCLRDGSITFNFHLRKQVTFSRGEIVGIENGLLIGSLRLIVAGGVTMTTKHYGAFWIAPYISEYTELVHALRCFGKGVS